jgi:hypothetical protein
VALPSSPNAISLSQIQTEFGGSNPISMNEYYAGGSHVPSGTGSIPSSGTISMSHFHGTSNTITSYSWTIASVGSGDYHDGQKFSYRHYWNGVRSGGGTLSGAGGTNTFGSWGGGSGTSNEIPAGFHTVNGKSMAGKDVHGIYGFYSAAIAFGPDKTLNIIMDNHSATAFNPLNGADGGINHAWSTISVPSFGTLYNKGASHVFNDGSRWYGTRSDTGARVLVERATNYNTNFTRYRWFKNTNSVPTGSQLDTTNGGSVQTDEPSVSTGTVTIS